MKEENKHKEYFKAFLIKHRAYKKYVNNLKTQCWSFEESMNLDKMLDTILHINYAFIWKDTPEGIEYWDNLCDKWNTLNKT